MRCNPLRWLWGLVPIAILTWLAILLQQPGIEAELAQQTKQALDTAGLNWARVEFTGRDATLAGKAHDGTEQSKARSIAERVWGVRVLDDQSELIAKSDIYRWAAKRDASTVQLTGHVPSAATRQDIITLAEATLPGQRIDDRMELSHGAPALETWLAGVGFGLKQLAALKQGEVRLDDLGLSLEGEARDGASYRGIKSALATGLPRGVRLTKDAVTAPVARPYVWAAKYGANQLILSGHVPSERVREEVFQTAKASMPRVAIVDRMEIAAGAPQGFAGAAMMALKELARLEEGNAEIRDATLSFAGLANDDAAAESVRRNVRSGVPGSIRLSDQVRVREPVVKPITPYTTAAVADASAVLLDGYAPSAEARNAVAEVARAGFPGRHIDNRIEIGIGAPEVWQRCFENGLLGLARLGAGRMTLSDRRLDLSGATEDEDLANALPNQLRTAVSRDCVANVRIERLAVADPDLAFRAVYDGSEVVLDGTVPGTTAKAELGQAAARIFRDASIVDRMRVVDARATDWLGAAESGLAALALLQRGEARLEKRELVVTGETDAADTAAEIREQITREMPNGYKGRDVITVAVAQPVAPQPTVPSVVAPPAAPPPVVSSPSPPPAAVARAPEPTAQRAAAARACQEKLKTAADEGTIHFERASADIVRTSYQTLDKLASIAKSCPGFRIEIEGHTDAEGTPERNQRLSNRRANSVMTYLVRAGVDALQLQPIGYGDTRPVAPNDTAENRARNRRIEFVVLPN
jgi:outer membrane protein OmpA-like peptidoglycan-associated protein